MKNVVVLLMLFVSFVSYAQKANVAYVNPNMEPFHINVDVKRAYDAMAVQGPNLVIIDVRTPEEVAVGKIKNALEIDIKSPDFKERIASLDKSKQYMVYCHAGGRSDHAMQIMKELGFLQVYNLAPGFKAWPKSNDN